jgi:excisionase family DNA binding protein
MPLQIIRSAVDALPALLTETHLAETLGVPISRIQRWRREGRIGPFVKVGYRRLMRREAFIAWAASREA